MTCSDFERLSLSDDPAERRALLRHAESCASCAARLQFEERLTEAARSMRRLAPDGALERVLERSRAPARRSRPWLRAGLAAAATLAIAALGFHLATRDAAPAGDALLSNADLRRLRRTESAVRERHTLLVEALSPAAPRTLSPACEEARHLDAAIDELNQALSSNPRNRHLRERMLELERRRNELLAHIAKERAG